MTPQKKRGAGRPPGAKNKKGTKADFENRNKIVKSKNAGAASAIRRCLMRAANAKANESAIAEDAPIYNNPVVGQTEADTGDITQNEITNNGSEGCIGELLWIPELRKLGFPILKCQVPSKAVQTIICCLNDESMHKRMIELELLLTDCRLSAIAYLGFSDWLFILTEKMKSEPSNYCNIIDVVYSNMQELICNRRRRRRRDFNVTPQGSVLSDM